MSSITKPPWSSFRKTYLFREHRLARRAAARYQDALPHLRRFASADDDVYLIGRDCGHEHFALAAHSRVRLAVRQGVSLDLVVLPVVRILEGALGDRGLHFLA